MTINISGEAGIQLVKEMKRSSLHTYPAYNQEQTKKLIQEMKGLFEEAYQIMSSGYSQEDTSTTTKLLMIHSSLKRSRRCLLAYHYHRLQMLLEYYKSPSSPEEYQRNKRNLSTENLTVTENAFIKKYHRSLDTYKRHFPDLSLFSSSNLPPKSLFIQVRVLEDIGVIQTERGSLSLTKHSLHYVRLTDVEHLIINGSVKVI